MSDTDAERFAAALDSDGQQWETANGEPFETLARRMGATVETWRPHPQSPDDDAPELYHAGTSTDAGELLIGGTMSGDRFRYVFPDDSAVVICGDCWDMEGERPGTLQGE